MIARFVWYRAKWHIVSRPIIKPWKCLYCWEELLRNYIASRSNSCLIPMQFFTTVSNASVLWGAVICLVCVLMSHAAYIWHGNSWECMHSMTRYVFISCTVADKRWGGLQGLIWRQQKVFLIVKLLDMAPLQLMYQTEFKFYSYFVLKLFPFIPQESNNASVRP